MIKRLASVAAATLLVGVAVLGSGGPAAAGSGTSWEFHHSGKAAGTSWELNGAGTSWE
ncbi:MAG: hypothetical protein H0V23_05920 [Nocardioidaceae bacterium]|nr:hypothetical protein [Nocardioidaceae bacterium]